MSESHYLMGGGCQAEHKRVKPPRCKMGAVWGVDQGRPGVGMAHLTGWTLLGPTAKWASITSQVRFSKRGWKSGGCFFNYSF